MARPILTDDMVQHAREDRENLEKRIQDEMENDQELSEKYAKKEKERSKKTVYKSRRIENAKIKERDKVVNRLLFAIITIVVFLLVLFFWYYFGTPIRRS
ncbi:MAG: cell wall synthase accessory phosphoprotein MacP [Streptococcaceae bacterium]|nr:cell wall synthase accessory phosphoprotein MacP [Streptococcaceae bacterium]MCL2681619.1 cell wall synthase accessory phosphoprotein MacP [Streptococcaceae bacterium]